MEFAAIHIAFGSPKIFWNDLHVLKCWQRKITFEVITWFDDFWFDPPESLMEEVAPVTSRSEKSVALCF